jgi:hypothetical protein
MMEIFLIAGAVVVILIGLVLLAAAESDEDWP